MSAPIGFPNFGSTCWLNSLIQSLSTLLEFKDELTFIGQHAMHEPQSLTILRKILSEQLPIQERHTMLAQLVRLFHPKFQLGVQHDCFEALLYLVDKCIEDGPKEALIQPKTNVHPAILSWIQFQKNRCSKLYSLFYSQVLFTCSDGEKRYEPLFGFIFSSTDVDNSSEKVKMSNLLNSYLANRNQRLTRISPILVLCCHNIAKSTMHKQLTFEPYIPIFENNTHLDYVCTGLIYHHGGLFGGHYTSIILHHDKKWYNCDDGRVELCTQFPTNIPTLLFYQRV